MKYFFDAKSLPSDEIAKALSSACAATPGEYQKILEKLIAIIKKTKTSKAKDYLYQKEIEPIKKHKPLTEPTDWGGVTLKKVDVSRDFIQKLLVIGKYGILGFEIHKKKLENLKVLEGECLVFYSNHKSPAWKKGKVTVKLASRGAKFTFQPYDEHGIIALTNCVVEETSTNHLDDLTYIFKSQQVNARQ